MSRDVAREQRGAQREGACFEVKHLTADLCVANEAVCVALVACPPVEKP